MTRAVQAREPTLLAVNESLPSRRETEPDHSACGVGLVARRDGKPSHQTLEDALRALTNLEHLIEHVESVDMVTMVLIGNSTSFVHQGRMVTPRGYEVKQTL